MDPKRILVTGASGFVGQPLVRALVRAGYAVRAATRRSVSFPSSVDPVIVPDFANPIDWEPILRGVDIVIHAGGYAHADRPDEEYANRVNSMATGELARAAARAGVERFLFISSVRAQTGASASGLVKEEDEAHPTDTYGRSKLTAELGVRAAGVPFTILRPVVIFGPRARANFGIIVRLASSPLPLPLAGFDTPRSVLGIDNLISVILFVLNNPAAVDETYLVADPEPVTVRELFTMLREVQGRRPRLVYIPPKLFQIPLTLVNRKHLWERLAGKLVVDTSKLQSLGWHPPVKTFDGLRSIFSTENGEGLSENVKVQPEPNRF